MGAAASSIKMYKMGMFKKPLIRDLIHVLA